MSEYENLLAALIRKKGTISITSHITVTNLRKGLKKALQDYNAMQAIMELPEIDKHFKIATTEKSDEGYYQYAITMIDHDEVGNSSFTFNIIED